MHLNADISSALQQIEAVKKGIEESNDAKLQMKTAESLKSILDILHDPVFRTIVHVEDSLSELNAQLAQHPSMLPNDFDIDVTGNLVLSVNGADVVYDFDEHSSGPRSGPCSPTGQKLADDIEAERPQSQNAKSVIATDLLAADYTQVQALELFNDGTGLGFGIIGARTSGVIVKTILSGGVADRDGRLKSGDHILQIGEQDLRDMGSEQVAAVLRHAGTQVRLVVARPFDESSPPGVQLSLDPGSAVVPSRVLVEPGELQRYLISIGYPEIFAESSTASTPQTLTENERFSYTAEQALALSAGVIDLDELLALPETEKLQVQLTKDANGLGITIAGYVCEKEELSGIFVKSVSPGSAADLSGCIRVNDRIIEVDGQSLQGFSNHQAVELLKKSGQVVNLRLERYLRGPKYDQLQQAIAANDKLPSVPSTPSRSVLPPPIVPVSPQRIATVTPIVAANIINPLEIDAINAPVSTFNESREAVATIASITPTLSTFGSGKKRIVMRDSIDGTTKIIPTDVPINPVIVKTEEVEGFLQATNEAIVGNIKHSIDSILTPEIENEIVARWRQIVDEDVEIIVAQIRKYSTGGLGISLEGTVDVEGGIEVRPHHYIRTVLPEGPAGVTAKLQTGDELLEVNGIRLLGMNHIAVVAILRELPADVRLVCGRYRAHSSSINLVSLENLLPAYERLVKAKSEGSLSTRDEIKKDERPLRSRSLEPLSGLAVWSKTIDEIELIKGDRGLGFSILDYQDPLDEKDTVIVIRSLVPGGVAAVDGRIAPGDRLHYVNDVNLSNASLDMAVQTLKGAPKGVVLIGVAKLKTLEEAEDEKRNEEEKKEEERKKMEELAQKIAENMLKGERNDELEKHNINSNTTERYNISSIKPDLITD